MGQYEAYVFNLLSAVFGDDWSRGDERFFSYGYDAGRGSVDGVLAGRVAVEIGAGSPKQIRAGLLDLILHPAPAKMLVLVDTSGHPSDRAALQAQAIMDRMGVRGQVVRLSGNPVKVDPDGDSRLLRRTLEQLDEAGSSIAET